MSEDVLEAEGDELVGEQPRRSRSGSDARQRPHRMPGRLSDREKADLEDAARAAGMTAGSFIRHVLTDGQAPRAVRRPPVDLEELRRILAALGKVGGNLNQIAHKLNSGDMRPSQAAIGQAAEDMRKMRDALLKALGFEVPR